MKKVISILFALIVLAGVIISWLLFTSATGFSDNKKTFIIKEGASSKNDVLQILVQQQIISNKQVFSLISTPLNVWQNIKPGKYEVKRGESLFNIMRMLKNGRQMQVNLVITKLRLNEDFARLIGKNFSTDSAQVMQFISSNDSLKQFNINSQQLLGLIIPDTYTFYWNTPVSKMIQKIIDAHEQFWAKNNRQQQAKNIGYSPMQIHTIASIVEEETNAAEDKGKIASVYMNRLAVGMPLQADPTIRYAMKDFTITRVYEKYLFTPSPYNTYRNKGLPPGPICTPSPKTIDAVLQAPKTDYIYFVAKADFSGLSNFANNYAQHLVYAKEYQQALNAYMLRKQQKKQQP